MDGLTFYFIDFEIVFLKGRGRVLRAIKNSMVGFYGLFWQIITDDPAFIKQNCSLTKSPDRLHAVGDQDDGLPGGLKGLKSFKTLALKGFIADGKNLVDQKDIRVHTGCD